MNQLYKQMVAGLAVAGLFACADTDNSGVMSRETPMTNPMTNPMDNPTPDAGTQMANPDSGVAVITLWMRVPYLRWVEMQMLSERMNG